MNKKAIRALQSLLAEKGFDPGPVDGLWGPRTEAAVEAYTQPELPLGVSLDKRSEKALTGVHADLVAVVRRAYSKAGGRFMVIEGLRTLERQKELRKQGATTTLDSRHLTGHAVDIVPLDDKGEIRWDWPLYHQLAPTIKQAAADLAIPLTWGGDWKTFKDGPHWELPKNRYPK